MSVTCKEPKLRFKEFSGEWEANIFKNIVKLQRGSSPRPIVKYITKSNDGVNWIKIGDILGNNNFINSTKEKITKEGAKKSRKVDKGEIILSNSMSYGKPIILNINGYIHDGWFVIRKFDNYFDKEYLLQVLGSEWIQKQYKRLAAGGVVNNISSELVNSVKINLPQKPEQQKIASFLSAVDNRIEQLTKKEQLLRAYKKGVMQKIFSGEIRFKDDDGSEFPEWVEKKLGELFSFLRGSSLSKSDIVLNGKYKCIHYGELFTNYHETIMVIKSKTNLDTGQFSKIGDILMPSSDVTPQGLATASALLENNVIIGGDINILRAKKQIDSIFVSYFLNNNKNEIMKLVTGTTIKHIYNKDVSKLKINFPPLKEQTKIANFLSSIDKKIEQTAKELNLTKEFKKGLLQQMFV